MQIECLQNECDWTGCIMDYEVSVDYANPTQDAVQRRYMSTGCLLSQWYNIIGNNYIYSGWPLVLDP